MTNTAVPENSTDLARRVRVRPARPEDVDRYLDLLEAVASERRWIGTEAPIDRTERRARFEERLHGDWANLLAEADGRLVGHIGLQNKRGLVEIGMMVAEGYRGRGIGSALMRAALDWGRERGAHKISLQVWTHNESAIALYEKFGFVREGHLVKQWKRSNGDLWDSYVMGLILMDVEDD
ncbi:MAG: GNAT family N-acetyltransferase [Actinomycetota bacterium]